jgi:hypothetical protein
VGRAGVEFLSKILVIDVRIAIENLVGASMVGMELGR